MNRGIDLVDPCKGWIFSIAFFKLIRGLIISPVKCVMKGGYEFHATLPHGFCQFPDDIPFRPHIHGIPFGKITVPHGEAVMMLCHETCKSCPGFFEQVSPLIRIKLFCSKQGNEILIPEFGGVTPMLPVVIVKSISSIFVIERIHQPGVPFVFPGRHGIGSPVCINAKLGIQEPFRAFIGLERFPGSFVLLSSNFGLFSCFFLTCLFT
ncbi:hypothetical protein ES708_27988 [subsurface metagenome]